MSQCLESGEGSSLLLTLARANLSTVERVTLPYMLLYIENNISYFNLSLNAKYGKYTLHIRDLFKIPVLAFRSPLSIRRQKHTGPSDLTRKIYIASRLTVPIWAPSRTKFLASRIAAQSDIRDQTYPKTQRCRCSCIHHEVRPFRTYWHIVCNSAHGSPPKAKNSKVYRSKARDMRDYDH